MSYFTIGLCTGIVDREYNLLLNLRQERLSLFYIPLAFTRTCDISGSIFNYSKYYYQICVYHPGDKCMIVNLYSNVMNCTDNHDKEASISKEELLKGENEKREKANSENPHVEDKLIGDDLEIEEAKNISTKEAPDQQKENNY